MEQDKNKMNKKTISILGIVSLIGLAVYFIINSFKDLAEIDDLFAVEIEE